MTWITELINGIPQIIAYIAPGFLMMAIFSWTVSHNFTDGKNVVAISTVLSYLIWKIAEILSDGKSAWESILVCLVSSLVGMVAAIVYKKKWFNNLLATIGVKRTTNKSIWDDAIGEGSWIAVWNSDENCYYCGQFLYQNTEADASYVVLSTYYVCDKDKNIVNDQDFVADKDRTIMVRLDGFCHIIIATQDPFGKYKT